VVQIQPALGAGLLTQSMLSVGVSGKVYVPVRPDNAVMYAQFRQVVGVSATGPDDGVSLLRLTILDNLIENYLSARSGALARSGAAMEVAVSASTAENAIRGLSADVHEAVAARPAPFGGAFGEGGRILSLSA
jgi:hypothetical protein